MVKVKKCSFCGFDIPIGRGIMFVRKDGTVLNFCTSKCRKSMVNFKRTARKVRWTAHYGKQ